MAHKTIDTRGRSCPEPVVMTKQALTKITDGQITVLINEEVAKENVTRFVESSGCEVEVKKNEEEYKLLITKG
ncbi:sulfurtransferase TusA family protein [Natroniella acetigena]|uniref:sulfurtransferase TusA family protein n=1 Tax=Natroniella acetigena TaxID=52004 RepID=UPI00200B5C2B|nr:sulfurtransferase TusA family protein [Natroniella acetigena]MCK8826778.1 sulfurtransferase TusA family protein [Natroniella acetigena]